MENIINLVQQRCYGLSILESITEEENKKYLKLKIDEGKHIIFNLYLSSIVTIPGLY